MSLAAIERGPQPSGREANISNAKEVFAGVKRQVYYDSLPDLTLARQSLAPTYPEQIPFVRDFLGASRDLLLSPIKEKIAEIVSKPYKPLLTSDLVKAEDLPLPAGVDRAGVNSASQERARTRQYEQILGLTPYEPEPLGRARLALTVAGAGLALLTACTPTQAAEVSPVSPTRPADATAAPGVGGVNPIATFEPTSEYGKELNPIIDRFNDPKTKNSVSQEDLNKVNAAKAKAAAEQSKSPTPEATPFQCKLLPDEYCNSGEPVIRPGRNIVTSIRFKAPSGTPISSLFEAKVTTVLGKEAEEGKKKVEPETTLTPLDKTIPPLIIMGDLKNQLVDTNDKGVGEGDQVAEVGPTGEIFVTWSGYNPADRRTVSAQEIVELFKRFFSEVMAKQPVVVPLTSAGGGWNVAEPKFKNNS